MTAPQLHFDDGSFGAATLREGRRNRVGRLDGDVVVQHEKVSKQHAELWRDGDRWWIADSASTNGVFVNDHQSPCEPGDEAHESLSGDPRANPHRLYRTVRATAEIYRRDSGLGRAAGEVAGVGRSTSARSRYPNGGSGAWRMPIG